MLYDGNGLYFRANGPGSGSWLLRYYRNNVGHLMGLGSFRFMSLAQARQRAIVERQLLQSGKDPITTKRQRQIDDRKKEQKQKTFSEVFEELVLAKLKAKAWRDHDRTAKSMRDHLTMYAYPVLRSVLVHQIDTAMVLKVLEPLWEAGKIVIAQKLRGEIKRVLDYAKFKEYRTGDNPAAGRDHIGTVAPHMPKAEPYASLPYEDLPAFWTELQTTRRGIAAEALKFEILAAGRPVEAVGARWDEFNLKTNVWRIPRERMKEDRDHYVPLTEPMLTILAKMRRVSHSEYVFPGKRGRDHVEETAPTAVLLRMKRKKDATPHGFRATFRGWATANAATFSKADQEFRLYLLELCLAHKSKAADFTGTNPQLERAYQRDELVEQRRFIMEEWSRFVTGLSGKPQVSKHEMAEAAD